jgi:hypothetical protein
MGGSTTFQDPMEAANRRIVAADEITAEQLVRAKELYERHFGGDNPPVMAAIIQALATNYLAVVLADGNK